MPLMQTLRRAHFLARLVLAWFVLALGVAMASPLVHPQSMELVCSSGGAVKLVVQDANGDGAAPQHPHVLDCPLCLHVVAPPLVVTPASGYDDFSLSSALRSVPAARIAGRTAAPLPPRGPPVFS
jgi:hypothetical protein